MKIFKYCNKQLSYIPVSKKFYAKWLLTSTVLIITLSFGLTYFLNSYYHDFKIVRINEEMKLVILQEHNKFDRNSCLSYMKKINLKFPHIVYAQAILESNDFTSSIFKENNNFFGMKVASARQSTNNGEQYEHATYETWKDCVIDYALYQARYLSDIKTETQYYEYLAQHYAEDTNYVTKLKKIIANKKLAEVFSQLK